MPITVDEKLFTHINNDAFLTGSFGLQGQAFARTIAYLDQFVTDLTQRGEGVSPEIKQLARACHLMVATQRAIQTQNKGILAKSAAFLQEQAIRLNKDEYILLPGGWVSITNHAMVYEIKKDVDGNLLFSIYNSGAGLEYHPRRQEKDKTKYNPVLTYKIPKEEIANKSFKSILQKLLEAQCRSLNTKDNAENQRYIYKTIVAQLEGFMGARMVESDEHTFQSYTAGQLSGTCSQRSLHQMLKARFHTDEYRQFIYRFKAKSLMDYVEYLQPTGTFNAPKYRQPIIEAIHHQLRLLNLKKTCKPTDEDLFDLTTKKEETDKLLKLLAALHAQQQGKSSQKKAAPLGRVPTVCIRYNRRPKKVNIPNPRARASENVDEVTLINGGESLLRELDALLAKCSRLNKEKQYAALHEQLEHLFNHLPLPDPPQTLDSELLPFYSALNSEEKAHAFYEKMVKLQILYFENCEVLIGKKNALARMVVTKLSVIAVTSHVNANHRMVVEGKESYCQYIKGLYVGFNPGSVYMATNDPGLDKRAHTVYAMLSHFPFQIRS